VQGVTPVALYYSLVALVFTGEEISSGQEVSVDSWKMAEGFAVGKYLVLIIRRSGVIRVLL
jgi:hypothetical protein